MVRYLFYTIRDLTYQSPLVGNVQAFLAVLHFPILPSDPTEKYQKLKHKTPQYFNKIIDNVLSPPPQKSELRHGIAH